LGFVFAELPPSIHIPVGEKTGRGKSQKGRRANNQLTWPDRDVRCDREGGQGCAKGESEEDDADRLPDNR
jgi:hypothetical protein